MQTIIKNQKNRGVKVLAAIIGVVLVITLGVVFFTSQSSASASTKSNDQKIPATSYHYFNDDVQGSVSTMYNLGPDRYVAGCTTAQAAKTDLLKSIDPDRGGDPSLAAAIIYYAQTESQTVDPNINLTRINITDRTEHNMDVEKAISDTQINVLGSRWTEDINLWRQAYTKFVNLLESSSIDIDTATRHVALACQTPHSRVFGEAAPRIAWSSATDVAGHWFHVVTPNGASFDYLLEKGYAFPADRYVAAGCEPQL